MSVDLSARPHPSDTIKLKQVIKGVEEPRLYTKPLRPLNSRTSHGFACIAFAEQVLGMSLMPWQKWMLIHALELRPDGSYRFRIVVCLVARQNGKTLVMQILALWHVFAKNSRWVMSTAQDLSNSEKAWNEARQIAQHIPELSDQIGDQKFQRGQKMFALREEFGECTWFVKSANRKSGRGFSCELVLLDEIREHTNFECWAAVTKTTRARANAQVWAFSNAGEFNSIVLRHLRALGHRDLGWPDGELDTESLELPDMSEFEQEFEDADVDFAWGEQDGADEHSLGFFEYSADPRFHRADPRGWAQANPSLNQTETTRNCVTTRVMKDDLRSDPPGVFDTECLCRWVATLDHGPFEIGSWDDTFNDEAKFAPDTERVLCVEVNIQRTMTYVARCGPSRDSAGKIVLDVAAARPGTHWVVDWLVRNRARYTAIVIRGSGAPAASLVDALQGATVDLDADAAPPDPPPEHPAAADPDDVARQIPFMDDLLEADLPIVLWTGDDLGRASGIMYDRLSTRTIEHLSHPALDAAAKTAKVRVLRDSWVIDLRNSPTDAAPLVAGIGAVWGMNRYYTIPEAVVPQVHTIDPKEIAAWEQQARQASTPSTEDF
jgi:hypothetical protein